MTEYLTPEEFQEYKEMGIVPEEFMNIDIFNCSDSELREVREMIVDYDGDELQWFFLLHLLMYVNWRLFNMVIDEE